MRTTSASKLQVKVTVMADETPALFAALSGVRNPRNRAARVKDLAAKGLLIEGVGGIVPAEGARRPTKEAGVLMHENMPEGFSVTAFANGFESDA
jgi:hypothetical protein